MRICNFYLILASASLFFTSTAHAAAAQILTTDDLANAGTSQLSEEARTRALSFIENSRSSKSRPAARAFAGGADVHPLLTAYADKLIDEPGLNHPLMRVANGQIDLRMTLTQDAASAVAQLEAMGLHVYATSGNDAYVSCPTHGLAEALAGSQLNPMINSITPLLGELVHTGSVLSEGDAALGADLARDFFGVDGSGVSVCVISDGTAGAVEAMLSGDLPADKYGNPDIEFCDTDIVQTENGGAEGTAMLEIIHDLAPGAELGFCPAFGPLGEEGLANAISYLADDAFGGKGCDIIVDDVAYLTEPYFEDGIVAQAVNRASRGGAAYFSSAGNSGDNHYERDFVDATPGIDAPSALVDLHDFGSAAGGAADVDWQGVVAGAGNFFAVFMQWNDKFGAASNDYDIYIFDENGLPAGTPGSEFEIGASGVTAQDGDDDPFEVAFVVNPDGAPPLGVIKPFFIVVDKFSGEDRLLEMNFNGLFAVDPTYNVPEGSIWGHAAARRAISVAATGAVANLDGTPNPMLDVIEPFSSQGPSRIFFRPNGKPVDKARRTPTLTATDGVSVTGFGGFPTTFFGTSASAPHAAAVAALALDKNPGLTPRMLRKFMRKTVDDRGERGFDSVWGKGLIDPQGLLALLADLGKNDDGGKKDDGKGDKGKDER